MMMMRIFPILMIFLAVAGLRAQSGNLTLFSGFGEDFVASINGNIVSPQHGNHFKYVGLPAGSYQVELKFTNKSLVHSPQKFEVHADRELTISAFRAQGNEVKLAFVNEFSLTKSYNALGEQKVIQYGAPTKPAEQPVSKPAEQPVAKPSEQPVSKPAEQPVSKPAEQTVAKPAEQIVSKPAEQPVSKPAEQPVAKPAEQPVSKPAEQPVSKPTEPPVAKPAEQPVAKPNPLPTYSGKTGCTEPIDNIAFAAKKIEIQAARHSTTRMNLAKQAIGGNCYLTKQIGEVMDMFTFDADKLELAKYAHAYTYDLDNYYTILERFIFAGTADDLKKFLQQK